VDAGLDVGLDEATAAGGEPLRLLSGTADMKEGTAAFLAKRKPGFGPLNRS
jgi:1,4-dihydroxy-2-naphthoyl-CoA synthase